MKMGMCFVEMGRGLGDGSQMYGDRVWTVVKYMGMGWGWKKSWRWSGNGTDFQYRVTRIVSVQCTWLAACVLTNLLYTALHAASRVYNISLLESRIEK